MPYPLNREQLTVVGMVLGMVILVILLWEGLIQMSEVSSALAFVLVTAIAGGGLSILVGRLLKGTELSRLWVMKRADRRFDPDLADRLDKRFGHVHAVFFYPKEVSWTKGERNPQETMPRYKAVVNTITQKAFWMGYYAMSLYQRGKIDGITETGNGPLEMDQYFKDNGTQLIRKTASEADLLEGT